MSDVAAGASGGWARGARAAAGGALALAAVAGAALAPLAVHWLAGRTLVWFDTLRLYAPERWLVGDALRELRLPLWNPFVAGGVPLFADAIHGVLHPISLLAAAAGVRGADALIGGYVACAAVGAAWLARELGASRAGAVTAAFAFGMSGFVLSMAGNLVFLAGAASLPSCVAGLRRVGADPRSPNLAVAAAAVAILAFSGDLQALAVGAFLGLALAWEASGPRGAARAAAAGVVGLLVAGVQLVPSAVHFLRSVRAEDGWKPEAAVWALEPWRIPELALPGLLWAPDPLMDPVYGALAGPGHWMPGGLPNPFAASLFVGVVPLALAVAGARAGRRGAVLAALAAVLLWVALGPALGADRVLGLVPVWRAFRYSEKLVGPLTLVIAVLAALGVDELAEGRARSARLLAVVAVLGLGSMAACQLAVSRLPAEVSGEGAARVARGGWHVLAGAGAAAAALVARRRLGAAPSRALLAAAVWAGLVAAAPAALRPGDPSARLAAQGPALQAGAPGPRIVTSYEYEPLAKAPGEDWIDVAAREHAAQGYAALNCRWRLDSMDFYGAMLPARLARLRAALGQRWPAAAGRYAVTHVVAEEPRSARHQALHALATHGATRLDPGSGPAAIWAIPHRPWASFPAEVRTVPDEGAALTETARAVAEQSPRVVVEGVGRFAGGDGRVLALERGLESLRVEAEAPRDATLVISDAWWPGWEATLDGAVVPIFRADALVRAVRWPAGHHVLEMTYRPPEVRTGLLVTALGVVGLGAWLALSARGRRRAPPR